MLFVGGEIIQGLEIIHGIADGHKALPKELIITKITSIKNKLLIVRLKIYTEFMIVGVVVFDF